MVYPRLRIGLVFRILHKTLVINNLEIGKLGNHQKGKIAKIAKPGRFCV